MKDSPQAITYCNCTFVSCQYKVKVNNRSSEDSLNKKEKISISSTLRALNQKEQKMVSSSCSRQKIKKQILSSYVSPQVSINTHHFPRKQEKFLNDKRDHHRLSKKPFLRSENLQDMFMWERIQENSMKKNNQMERRSYVEKSYERTTPQSFIQPQIDQNLQGRKTNKQSFLRKNESVFQFPIRHSGAQTLAQMQFQQASSKGDDSSHISIPIKTSMNQFFKPKIQQRSLKILTEKQI